MNITDIIIAAGVMGIIGLLVALLLVAASKVFAVESDELESMVRERLPGINCGACGYASCGALAEAIVKGEAPSNACLIGKAKTAQAVAEVMEESAKKQHY